MNQEAGNSAAERRQRYLRLLELEARAEQAEDVELSLNEFAELAGLVAEFGAFAVDVVAVRDPRNPRRVRHRDILNTDVVPIAGDCPLVCPQAEPPFQKWMLPSVEKRCRELGIIGQGQTVLYVGQQTKPETVCGFFRGCDCFAKNPIAPDPPEDVAHTSGRKPKPKAKAPTVNDRMILEINKNQEALGWNSSQWAKQLKCAKSTVAETETWKSLQVSRLQARAERRRGWRHKGKD